MSKKIDPGVQKCIAALQAAKDDTEKMAALFLVTKIVKAPKLDSENRIALFNAIGFKFLLKLLNSPSTADCPEVLVTLNNFVFDFGKSLTIVFISYCSTSQWH